MKTSIYIIVFGILALLVAAAWLSTFVFNMNPSSQNVSLSNLQNYGPAPNIQGITYWINSQPLNMSQLRDKVVLVDFWTYSCINCIRTIPFLNALQQKYGNDGLVIIGVHTPEFQFEKNYTNVRNAVGRFNITYPVAMDSNYATWIAYSNQYWPADYIIDRNGGIRYIHFGEGGDNQIESVIRELLQDAGYSLPSGMLNVTSNTVFQDIQTPELYLGYATAREPIGNSQGFMQNQTVNYTINGTLANNTAYLSGQWYNAPDSMVSVNGSKLFLVYSAKNVNVVAAGNTSISVKLDGKNPNSSYLGSDDTLENGTAMAAVNGSRLYNIVSAPSYGWHTLEIDAQPGFRIYTFTFG
ncbi:MAG: redoxin family protein [Candidatus Micrarchaeota archaeon]|nr:redoxin family protein [Candidatus Micrarchaeota archaeon]